MDVRVLPGLVCPAARPDARPAARLGNHNTPEPLRAAGKKWAFGDKLNAVLYEIKFSF